MRKVFSLFFFCSDFCFCWKRFASYQTVWALSVCDVTKGPAIRLVLPLANTWMVQHHLLQQKAKIVLFPWWLQPKAWKTVKTVHFGYRDREGRHSFSGRIQSRPRPVRKHLICWRSLAQPAAAEESQRVWGNPNCCRLPQPLKASFVPIHLGRRRAR